MECNPRSGKEASSMGRRVSALCAGCLALLIPLLIHAARVLPVDTGTLVAEK